MREAKEGGLAAVQCYRCLVYCRLRPVQPDEDAGIYKHLKLRKQSITVDETTYVFDRTFKPRGTQEAVFQEVARPLVDHVVEGYNAAITAYGQPGTGKSFTMSNFKPGQEGIIPRSAGHLFELIENTPTKTFSLSANFVQIYRDKLTDLMDEGQARVVVRFTKEKGVELINCTTVQIGSKEDFMAMYREGVSRSVVRPTKKSPESSRGHTALVLHVRVSSNGPADVSKRASGKITFLDLAGCDQRLEEPPCHQNTAGEVKQINASLASLGAVVAALSACRKKVPWNQSGLTRLMQDSLGGTCRSAVVHTVGPAAVDNLPAAEHGFALCNRAMAIRSVAKQELAIDYQKLAAQLQAELNAKNAKIDSLERAAKRRAVEDFRLEARLAGDTQRLRRHHADELRQLVAAGATPGTIQRLLDVHATEDEDLQDEHHNEREFAQEQRAGKLRDLQDEHHNEREFALEQRSGKLQDLQDRHHNERGFAQENRAGTLQDLQDEQHNEREFAQEQRADKLQDLQGATQRRAGGSEELKEVNDAQQNSGKGGAGVHATVGRDDAASAQSAAEVASLRREIEAMKQAAAARAPNLSETEAAHAQCACMLEEVRAQNESLAKASSANVAQFKRLESDIEQLKAANSAAHQHHTSLKSKLEDTRQQLSSLQAHHEQAHE
ncbi:hypothetical protein DIPPA_22233 [Diplonema papillatum]|nr:hypothetical protein DIPPA_22233 [Diplonema papillatum]